MYYRKGDKVIGSRALPWTAVTEESIGKSVERRLVCVLRLGRFGKRADAVHLRMGQYSFDVLVTQTADGKGPDSVVPGTNVTVGEFLKRLAKPSLLDGALGLPGKPGTPGTEK